MWRAVRWVGLAGLLLVCLSPVGADDKKKDDKKPGASPEKGKDEKKPPAGEKKPDDSKRAGRARSDFRDRFVVLRVFEARLGKVDDAQKLGVIVKEPYLNGNKVEYRDAKEAELPRADDLIVRFALPPPQFDEKGRPKRPSKKELEELRGADKSLPGYAADVDSLKPGQTVGVYWGKKKSAPKNDPPAIVMIVILKEAPS